MKNFSINRFLAFLYKESLQVIRDPSSILIAFILPCIMIFLFAFGVSLDTNTIRIGVVLEDTSPLARSLSDAFEHTRYFMVNLEMSREKLVDDLMAAKIRGIVVIPQDFSQNFLRHQSTAIQVIADGSETNTASFVQNYSQGVVNQWTQSWLQENGIQDAFTINPESRIWFNPTLKSRDVILPGSIAVIMALIGTLLTALIVAREWERGTMEAVLATPIRIPELLISKLTPYFILGMGSMLLCIGLAVLAFDVPFVGSLFVLILATAIFLVAGLSQGLLISILAKNQFIASQIAINAAFLPAYMLSGFLYEIQTMPLPIRLLTYLFAPRYFVSIIQTDLLAGVIWSLILPDMLAMLGIAAVFIYLIIRKSKKSLE